MDYKISLENCKEFIAGDGTILREILGQKKEGAKINYSIAWFEVLPNQKTKKHSLKSTELYFIISGKGRMHIGDGEFDVESNDTVYIPPNSVQYIENKSDSEPIIALCIVDPSWKKEDETVYE